MKCCLGHCTSRTFCPCRRNADCPSRETCFLPSFSCQPIAAQSPKPTTHSSTSAPNTQPISCVRDSECKGRFVCKGGQCDDNHRSTEHEVQNAWSRSEAIVALAFVALPLIIGCVCFLCRKARKRHARARVAREAALNATRVAYHEMQPGSPSVIFMDDAPPPYSLLEFERQQNEIDEPPSYDDAVRISAMPAVGWIWPPLHHPPENVSLCDEENRSNIDTCNK